MREHLSSVFAAFTDPNELARWWGPEGFTMPSVQFDPHVGRTNRIEIRPPEVGAFYLTGEVREVVSPPGLHVRIRGPRSG